MNEVVAIIVTYNRKNLLKECIYALLGQKNACLDILIIDNASTDGTYEVVKTMISDQIIYENTGKNLGGAGGFSFGLKKAYEMGYKYGWIMDDDAVPFEDALYNIIRFAQKNDFSFLASTVYWKDMTLFPMNIPALEQPSDSTIDVILNADQAVAPIKTCSFVGCFVNMKYVKEAGLPISEIFIYGDDVEYTKRLRKLANAYLIYDSKIMHKAPSKVGADISSVPKDRLDRFYYQSRNAVYIARSEKSMEAKYKFFSGVIKRFYKIIKSKEKYRIKRLWVLIKGTCSGFFFEPEIKYPNNKVDDVNHE